MRGYFTSFFLRSKVSNLFSVIALAALLGALVATGVFRAHSSVAASPGDWPTYQFGAGRSGFNSTETIINQTTVQRLKLHWTRTAAAPISAQAVEANSLIYWGSWDGLEHATNLTGTDVWQTQLGTTNVCGGTVGVASTATISSIAINGTSTVVDFVGGGNGQFYALNAMTGAIIWQTLLGSPPDNFLWSSPLLYNGSIYEGVASSGDCPVVQGKLIQMNAQTGVIQHTFNTVPNGCTGAGVWGSPTLGGGSIYIATGNAPTCSTATSEPYAEALVKLRASDLTVEGSWQIPPSQRVDDNDFGSTPTLFPAKINGTNLNLVGIGGKNGIYYAFNRSNIRGGPIWSRQVAVGGPDPTLGQGTISPSAWDGSQLYVAGGNTTINGTQCQGSLRALNPATGAFLWEHCLLSGPVLGSVTGVRGAIVVGAGSSWVAVNAKTGATLFTYQASNGQFWSGASISNGMLYITSVLNQTLYAFGL